MAPTINMRQLNGLKQRRLESLQHLQNYANADGCRSAFWVQYFTQQNVPSCGSCDWCKKKQVYVHPETIREEIVSCLSTTNPIDMQEFTWNFPLAYRNLFFQELEKAIDEGIILKTSDNQLILSS